MEITRRYRVNVGTSVKGVRSYDCTVELTFAGEEMEQKKVVQIHELSGLRDLVLAESDALVKALDERYPAPKE